MDGKTEIANRSLGHLMLKNSMLALEATTGPVEVSHPYFLPVLDGRFAARACSEPLPEGGGIEADKLAEARSECDG